MHSSKVGRIQERSDAAPAIAGMVGLSLESQLAEVRSEIESSQVSTTMSGMRMSYEGSEISFDSLPSEVQDAIRQEFQQYGHDFSMNENNKDMR